MLAFGASFGLTFCDDGRMPIIVAAFAFRDMPTPSLRGPTTSGSGRAVATLCLRFQFTERQQTKLLPYVGEGFRPGVRPSLS